MSNLKTYGDLKRSLDYIRTAKKDEKIGNAVISAVIGNIPGIGQAKTVYDLLKVGFKKPDTKKTDSWLDKLDVDDEVEAIVDDTVEDGFLRDLAKRFESEPDDKPLEPDFNMNQKMVDYLKDNYKERTVTGIKEQKSVFDKFFTKFAYKFDKGYPDMNNDQDVLLLESLISEVIGGKFSLKEITDAEEGLEILKKELDLPDDKYFLTLLTNTSSLPNPGAFLPCKPSGLIKNLAPLYLIPPMEEPDIEPSYSNPSRALILLI